MNELSMVLAVSQATPSFDSLFLTEFNQIFGYVQRLVGDLAAAHRLTEESFHQLARYYRKGRKPIEARALLYLIATQRAREQARKGDKRSLVQRLFARGEAPLVEFAAEDTRGLATDTSQRALSTLEFGSRVVLLLHDYCGLSYSETARAAGIGKSAAARELDRARHEFKQAYDYIKF